MEYGKSENEDCGGEWSCVFREKIWGFVILGIDNKYWCLFV